MKIIAIFSLVVALLGGGFVSTASAELRIGTVDIKKVFDSYYKTKEAERQATEQRNRTKTEMEGRLQAYQQAVAELKKLDEEVKRPEISSTVRDAKQKELVDKVGKLKTREQEDSNYRGARDKELQELSMRLRDEIMKDVMSVVTERAKSEKYDLVFDLTGPSLNSVPVLLYAKESYDFTPDVVTALNKSKGAQPAVKPAEVVRPVATPKKPK